MADDTNQRTDSFIHSLLTDQTTRVSIALDGSQANADSYTPRLSADGHLVAFASYATNLTIGDNNRVSDVFVHDVDTGQTTLLSVAADGGVGNAQSLYSSLSWDGRFAAFTSFARDLVDGDTNDASDVFVRDLQTGQTMRVSIGASGTQASGSSVSSSASLSADG